MKNYTLIVERPVKKEKPSYGFEKNQKIEDSYFFKNFPFQESALKYISGEAKESGVKIKKIIEMDYEGETQEMTIAFVDGVIGFAPVLKAESISDVVRELGNDEK